MSGFLLLCTELTLFCIELPENCIYLNQSELSNFFMFHIINIKIKFVLFFCARSGKPAKEETSMFTIRLSHPRIYIVLSR